jgi:hypothetical protein
MRKISNKAIFLGRVFTSIEIAEEKLQVKFFHKGAGIYPSTIYPGFYLEEIDINE